MAKKEQKNKKSQSPSQKQENLVPKGLKYSLANITPEQLEDLQVVIRDQTANSLSYITEQYDPLVVASGYLSVVRQIYMLYLNEEEAETLFEWARINMDPRSKEAFLH
jgi:hypothetical protein